MKHIEKNFNTWEAKHRIEEVDTTQHMQSKWMQTKFEKPRESIDSNIWKENGLKQPLGNLCINMKIYFSEPVRSTRTVVLKIMGDHAHE